MRALRAKDLGHREGAIDGANLFFGALLGANLGTLDRLRLVDYVQIVVLLAGTVMALRMVSTSGKRATLVLLAVYAALLTVLVTVPGVKPEGLSVAELHRLVATLAVWVVMVIGVELWSDRAAPAVASEDVPA